MKIIGMTTAFGILYLIIFGVCGEMQNIIDVTMGFWLVKLSYVLR